MVKAYYPKSVSEALKIKAEEPSALLISGGTDAMVQKKTAENIIFLNQVEDMKGITDCGDFLSVGAGTVYREVLLNALTPELLKKAVSQIASPAIRNAGTIAGNICNASPAGDTLPILYLMDAEVVLSSFDGVGIHKRKVPIDEFIKGVRKIDIRENEILTSIKIMKVNGKKLYYEKVGARRSEAISKLSFAGIMDYDEKIEDFRMAFGSVGITALRFRDLENEIKGLSIEEFSNKKTEIIEKYMDRIHPIDDQRSTAIYRRKVCENLICDFLTLT